MSGQQTVTQKKQQPQQSPMEILETSLKEEQTKVGKIDEIIKKLQAQQIEVKKKSSNNETSFYKILGKYITFLEYIKSIIEVKIGKDEKIIELQQNVFNSINDITSRIQNIKLSLPQKEANISETAETPVQTNDNPNNTIEELNNKINELKGELDELKKKQDKEKVYLLDFNTSNTGLNLDNKGIIEQRQKEINNIQKNCTKDIKNNVNDFIKTLNSAQSGGTNAKLNSPSFKDNTKGHYDIISNTIFKIPNTNYGLINNIEVNQENHTKKLKKIKEAYEKELETNIKNYEKICDALITLLEKINETNDKLKKFNGSKIIINQMNKVNKEIQEANKKIQVKNKEIQDANKIIEDKREKKAQIKELSSEISILKNSIAQGTIIYKILDLQDIKNDEIFKANHEALVGENGKSGLLGKITNAQSKLLNINIPQNTTQPQGKQVPGQNTGTGNPSQGNSPQARGTQGQQAPSPAQGQRTGNLGPAASQKINTSSEINVPISTFLYELKSTNNDDIKDDIKKIVEEQIRNDINKELNELEQLDKDSIDYQNKIKEIEALFNKGEYTLSDGLKEQFQKVEPPGAPFSDHERYLLLKFISLLTVSGKFEAGLEELNKDVNLKELIIKIFKSNTDKERQKLLIELYEKRPKRDLTKGGKYKKKKSKNLKSRLNLKHQKKRNQLKNKKQQEHK